jgi:hypothetical protein
VGLVEFLLVLAVLAVGLPLSYAMGTVLGRLLGMRWLARALPATLLVVAIAGIPVAFTVSGVPADATVAERREFLIVDNNGEWRHSYGLVVRYLPPDPERVPAMLRSSVTDSVTRTLVATEAVFDSASAGATIGVVYLSRRPELAKLADVGWLDILAAKYEQPGARIALVLIGIVGIAFALIAWAPRSETARGMRRAWLAACAVGVAGAIVWSRVEPLFTPAADDAFTVAVDAVVENVTTYTERIVYDGSYELKQPFDLVQVAFRPASLVEPVRTAAAIDAGSVAGLAEGTTVRVLHVPGAPRRIHIDGGTREFVRANAAHEMRNVLIIAGVCVAVLLLGMVLVVRRRGRVPAGVAARAG